MPRPWTLALLLPLAVAALAPANTYADEPPPAPSGGAAEEKDWRDHMGDLPFVVGYAKGMEQVEFTGRPPMYFFTATW